MSGSPEAASVQLQDEVGREGREATEQCRFLQRNHPSRGTGNEGQPRPSMEEAEDYEQVHVHAQYNTQTCT